jgi:hypothetical protein
VTDRRGRRDPLAEADQVRRLTGRATIETIGLNGLLFIQVGVSTVGVDQLDQQG